MRRSFNIWDLFDRSFLWGNRVLCLHLLVLLSRDEQMLDDARGGGGRLRKCGLRGLCHADQYLPSLSGDWDLLQRWRSLVQQRHVL